MEDGVGGQWSSLRSVLQEVVCSRCERGCVEERVLEWKIACPATIALLGVSSQLQLINTMHCSLNLHETYSALDGWCRFKQLPSTQRKSAYKAVRDEATKRVGTVKQTKRACLHACT